MKEVYPVEAADESRRGGNEVIVDPEVMSFLRSLSLPCGALESSAACFFANSVRALESSSSILRSFRGVEVAGVIGDVFLLDDFIRRSK